jgi:ribosomal protein S13
MELRRILKKKYQYNSEQISHKSLILRKLDLRDRIVQQIKIQKKKPLFRSRKRIKIGARFFYLFPNSNFLGRLVGKIRTIGIGRKRLISAYVGFSPNFQLVRTRPFRLNNLILKKVGVIIHKNFLVDRLTLRFIKEQVNRKMKGGSLYNLRVLRGLPVRGQRSKTNSRSARSYFKRLKLTIKKF